MKMIATALIAAMLLGAPASADEPGDLPDATHPGALNPAVTQENIHQTICVPSYSKSIRPPPAYTTRLKIEQLREMGASDQDPRKYEEDHEVPLSLGGHPTDRGNLWPEHWDGEFGAPVKDRLELKLYKMVCTGQVLLADAQHAIAPNWKVAYRQFCSTDTACPAFGRD
jgi:hypothetical protein